MKKRILPLLLALLLLFLSSCNHAGIGTALQAGSQTGEENIVTTGTQEPSETTDTQGTLLETDTQAANETDSSTSVETSTNMGLLEMRQNPPEIFYDVDETLQKSKSNLTEAYLWLQSGKAGADYSDQELLKQLSATLMLAQTCAVFRSVPADFEKMLLPNDEIAALVEKTSGPEGKDSLLYYIEKAKLYIETKYYPSVVAQYNDAFGFSFDTVDIKDDTAMVKMSMQYTFQFENYDYANSKYLYELKFLKSGGVWHVTSITSNDTIDQGYHFKPFDYDTEYVGIINQIKIEKEAKKIQ